MNWKELIRAEIEETYRITETLIDMVNPADMDWKPETGENWMTIGQLLHHIGNSCGAPIKGLATGEWGVPEEEMSEEDMLPPAAVLPAVTSLTEAKLMLKTDKETAIKILSECTENELATSMSKTPWDPREMVLGHRMLQMIDHLKQHKGQLFYYMKLQSKPVNTAHLWGM